MVSREEYEELEKREQRPLTLEKAEGLYRRMTQNDLSST